MSTHNFVHSLTPLEMYLNTDKTLTYVDVSALVDVDEIAQNFQLMFGEPLLVETSLLHIPVLPAQNILHRYVVNDETQDAHTSYYNIILGNMGDEWRFYEHVLPLKADLRSDTAHIVCAMMDNRTKTMYRLEHRNDEEEE